MNKPKSVIRYLLVCVVLLIGSSGVFSQTTIVNYDFNQGTSYPSLSPNLVNNITSSASSSETWQSYTGISSGIDAFTVNSIAGSALAMTSSSGTNTRYFQFHLGGSDLSTYASYKVYMQSQRSATGADTITLAYSTDGTNYTNFETTQSPGNGFFEQCQFDLSAIAALNVQSAIYFRIFASGASGSGTLRIDNFQVRATQLTCISPTRLLYKTQPVAAIQGSVMNVFSVATACVSDSIATNCNNGSITLAYSGTDLSGTLTMPVVNGVATFTDIAISIVQSNLSFTASYSGSCGSLTQTISNTFNVLPLRNENFDGSTPTWSYSIGTPTVIGSGGIVGADVTGLKNYGSPNNNSLTKSYSIDNFSGEIGTLNTTLFSNVTGLNAFDQINFSFQIGSLGSGNGAGPDIAEYMLIETSLDGGTTWNNLLKNNGFNDHLFALSSLSPVTLAYNANAIYSSGDPLWNQSAFQVDLPRGTTQFMFRITSSSNRTNENWAIDNVILQYVSAKLLVSANITDYENDSLKGIANLTITRGTPPYNVAWNGLKLPTPTVAYHLLLDSLPGITIDSVQFKNYIDSLRQRTVFNNLESGTYSVTVYDQLNDSVLLSISVGEKINEWALTNGVSTSTNNINSRTIGNVNYIYGSGTSITQQGVFSAGNSFAIPLVHIDLVVQNEMSFVIPNNTDIAYVGMRQDTLTLNGDTTDINQKTMFRFNGNGTFDVVYQAQSIFNGTFSSGDQFALRTNIIPGKITYYKNEIQVAQADLAPINNTASRFMSKVVLGNTNAVVSGLRRITPVVILPPPNLFCSLISIYNNINVSATPNPVCIGSTTQLSGQLKDSQGNNIGLANNAYMWQPGSLNEPNPPPVIISAAQVYELNITYLGCILKKTISITVLPTPIVNISTPATNICPEGTAILTANISGGSDVTPTYQWQLNGNIVGTNLSNYSSTPTLPGAYKVIVTNSNGCSATSPVLNITQFSPILFTTPYFKSVTANSSFILGATPLVTGGTPPYTYNWNQTGSGFSSNLENPSISGVIASSSYNVIVTDASTCSQSQIYTIGITDSKSYAVLKKELDASYYLVINGKLYFTVKGDYNQTGLDYKIYSYNRSLMSGLINNAFLENGDNRFNIDVTSLSSGFYVLEVVNQKREKLVLRFKI